MRLTPSMPLPNPWTPSTLMCCKEVSGHVPVLVRKFVKLDHSIVEALSLKDENATERRGSGGFHEASMAFVQSLTFEAGV